MKCICPECKNDINLSNYPDVSVGQVIECDTCGITLEVINTSDDLLETEIVDEGK